VGVFAYLLLASPAGYHRRDRLAGLFWPDQPDSRARGSLRNALYGIREALGEEVIATRGDEDVSVDRTRLTSDVISFEEAITAGELARALELFRGDLLAGFFPDSPALEQWLEERRTHYRTAAADAAWALATRYESATDLTSATRWARKAARLAGADDRRIRRILTLMAKAGDRAGAIGVFEEFSRFVERELQAKPDEETRKLVERIREGWGGS
jgi:DNA-binding SARP family transcriptional activator